MFLDFAENLEYRPILWWMESAQNLRTEQQDFSKAAVGADDLNFEFGIWILNWTL